MASTSLQTTQATAVRRHSAMTTPFSSIAVAASSQHHIVPTGLSGGQYLTITYLDDWKDRANDGEEFAMYVQLLRDVNQGEDIFVCYGSSGYWNDRELGQRMSNAIVLD